MSAITAEVEEGFLFQIGATRAARRMLTKAIDAKMMEWINAIIDRFRFVRIA
ncbi:MAG TPA: hypothetical protein VEI26_02140 [Terriglobales bacterium]|nr:hypothetical protein [Terriglobales bacterium]